ncbi:LOB domain-containing protein 15-like [Phoenix dactylifera]|uniref:LOB domain-containing protein 15-like n=1 Tax=Phoenix dactylifera TaxID=42345 RepID=A0A8B9ASX1_PHODC|nr:LOB domain-containing protein 15-like [Phoenix dactylifera]XP_038989896.1 LOB domain-containing protein 15-like [Phoenix dactylifera]
MSNITTESSMDSSSPPPPVRHAPCAVCAHLRQRCRRDCPFALHFPGDRPTCLDFLCLAYGAQHAARMLGLLDRGQWTSAAHSLVYAAILRLRNREREALDAMVRLQNEVVDLQVSNSILRNQIAARQQPRQRPLSIYDLIQWPTNGGLAGVNQPPGGQTGRRPPASGPGEGIVPPGGQHGAPSSSGDNNRFEE